MSTPRPVLPPPNRRWLFPTLRGYQVAWLRADVLAGITAGAVVIPQAMAYSTIANLPVEIGLYTCMLPLIVYAAIGGSRAMSVTTTSTIATLTATTLVSAGVADDAVTATSDLVTLTLLVGVILIVARVFRLGVIIENINEATLVGIKVGLGATVALGQVPRLLGIDVQATGHGFFSTVVATIEALPGTNAATLVLSLGSIAVLLVLRRWAPRVPGQLVVVVAGILLASVAGLPRVGVDLIDPVPTGLPLPALPPLDGVVALLPGALAIAVMAFLESASVARGIRSPGDPQVDSNRELLANGAASVAGAFFHSLPAAGGFSQSAVNQRAGAKTQVASVVTAALAILVALVLAPVLDYLPQATLAAMVFVAVVGLIDVRGLVRFARASRIEFWICVTTAVVGLVAGLLPAVIAGVVLTLGTVLREISRPRFTRHRAGSVLRVSLGGGLYTGNVFATQRAIERVLDEEYAVDPQHPIAVLEVDASAVPMTTLTVIDALADFDRDLAGRGVQLRIRGLAGDALALARKTRWWTALERDGRTAPLSPVEGDPPASSAGDSGRTPGTRAPVGPDEGAGE
ncbi:SulP family inorganic anion transporter [Glaciihabitans sp. dw_435]|uniref:SulP family inorganic anion transporter n=1 Tax=Glaciihabitans sp. dw_435 TaxID=2720081 RepID=UPI0027DBE83F|nr:SulP family inorganic anion transporter [Glaciihabitans sp. dw_435]